MITLGIDLGTTNSLVGFHDKDRITLIPNDRGKIVTPSVVAFRGKQVLVGESAKNQAVINPLGTISQVKRWMGSVHRWEIEGNYHDPVEVSSLILSYLKKTAEGYLGTQTDSAVITVPAYFSEPQRKSTLDAANLAGWKQVKLINEPTAAALAWVMEKGVENGLVMVYDWGGGTFDVSLVRVKDRDFYVLGTTGDSHLGGMDFDEMIFSRALEKFERSIGKIDDPGILQQLRQLSESAKIELSSEKETQIALPFVGNGKVTHLAMNLTRQEFDQMIRPSVDKTLELCAQVFEEASISLSSLSALILSGGTTRIPQVKKRLEDWTGLRLAQGFNPEEAVCRGASLFADMSHSASGRKIYDVTAFDLGLEIEGGDFFPLIRANTRLPAQALRQFTTVEDGQTIVEIHVQQRHGQDLSSLGKFLLEGIAPLDRGLPRIDVSFKLDIDGILTVEARDRNSGISQELTITQLPALGIGTPWEVVEGLLQEVEDLSWDRIPLDLLHRKKEWLDLLLEARAVVARRDVQRKEDVYSRLREMQLQLKVSKEARRNQETSVKSVFSGE